MRVRWLPLLFAATLLLGCSDYYLQAGLATNPPPLDEIDEVEEPEPEEPTPDEADPEEPEDPEEIEDPPPDLPSCEETIIADWQWWGSQPFEHPADPTDDQGRPFWAVDYDMVGYSTVALPDQGHTPPGMDRAYVAWFEVWGEPPALFLSMQSDDGLAFWVNGTQIGEWGGGWQEEGCVNDDASCTEFVLVDPVDIAPLLHEGWNVVAARVTNAVDNTFFDTYTECVD